MEIKLNGVRHEGIYHSDRYPRGAFGYTVFIPECPLPDHKFGLLVTHDGLNDAEPYALQELAKTGEAPWCISIGVNSGAMETTIPDANYRFLRLATYDLYGSEYADFLVEELIPYLIETYNLSIDPSADLHMVSGGSSGGLSAWQAAWYHSEFFHRIYMSSPSFLAMARGDEHLRLIRKQEPRPLRVWTEYSENEPNNFWGCSCCAGETADRSLRYMHYAVESQYYPGESHCSRGADPEAAMERMRYLWKDWQTKPVTVNGYSPQAEAILLPGEGWERTDSPFEKRDTAVSTGAFTAAGTYVPAGKEVHFHDASGCRTVAQGFDEVSAVAISSDKWILYIADRRRGCLYQAPVLPDGTLAPVRILGPLHNPIDFHLPGAFDLCVDQDDRLYAATELGIQIMRSGGFVDVILDNPAGRPADAVSLSADGYLYARCGSLTFRRKLRNKQPAMADKLTAAQFLGYGDPQAPV